MQVIRDITTLTPDTPVALTVGVFDGIHLGHQHLIRQAAQAATALGGKAGMITFWPHPLEVLHPERNVSYLTMLEEKLDLLAKLGTLDLVVVLPFTPKLSQTSASGFVDLLTSHLALRVLVEGADFVFGHNREGNMAYLRAYGETHGFAVQTVDLQVADHQRISSTTIRALLADGQVGAAMTLLGRPYSARGRVIYGDQRGRLMGFPTANLKIDPQKILPADGVYAARVRVGNSIYHGAANIGVRPTVDGTRHLTEVHVLDVQQDFYGKELELQFIARLRGEQRFAGIEALQAQIAADVQQARAVLGRYAERESERGESGERALEV
ncbi:MAG TPA: bifunctional riboflavin kinase/FAD synthetase [Ktedonobacterales bacterium]|nr:bifunctional riboflavin kinase/FAD synthetase [Ktedonobacterales bacterium]